MASSMHQHPAAELAPSAMAQPLGLPHSAQVAAADEPLGAASDPNIFLL